MKLSFVLAPNLGTHCRSATLVDASATDNQPIGGGATAGGYRLRKILVAEAGGSHATAPVRAAGGSMRAVRERRDEAARPEGEPPHSDKALAILRRAVGHRRDAGSGRASASPDPSHRMASIAEQGGMADHVPPVHVSSQALKTSKASG